MLLMLSQSYDIAVVFHFPRDKEGTFAAKTRHPCFCCNTLFLWFGLLNRGCSFLGFAQLRHTKTRLGANGRREPLWVLTMCDSSMSDVFHLCDGDHTYFCCSVELFLLTLVLLSPLLTLFLSTVVLFSFFAIFLSITGSIHV